MLKLWFVILTLQYTFIYLIAKKIKV